MNIAGLQKMTLLDFPGRVACTVFLQGCNFRCPFCHNRDLLPGKGEALMDDQQLLAFLKKRQGLLDGVCITGGEPTLREALPELLQSIKALGYAVKLDTNGAHPEVLKAVVEAGYVDYVAMDIKNSPDLYGKTAGMQESLFGKVEESIRYLLAGNVDYEFRTTVVAEFHDLSSVERMGAWVQKLGDGQRAKQWYLQCFADRDSVLVAGLHAPETTQMRQYAAVLALYAEFVDLRGVD